MTLSPCSLTWRQTLSGSRPLLIRCLAASRVRSGSGSSSSPIGSEMFLYLSQRRAVFHATNFKETSNKAQCNAEHRPFPGNTMQIPAVWDQPLVLRKITSRGGTAQQVLACLMCTCMHVPVHTTLFLFRKQGL